MCDRLLIVTQSCDLVHGSFEHEPAVEAYLCELLSSGDKPDGNLTAGKNPRTLMVPFSIDGDARWFRICSNGRMLFPRHLLASLDPDDAIEISDDAVAILKRWLVNRVIRTAFPDAFNDRTAKARQRLEKLLKKGGEPLLGLYINLTPWDELPENQEYLVDLIGLVAENLDFDQRKAVEKLVGQIAVAYENTDGIDSCDFEVLGEEDFPIRRLRTHRLFPLDFMSLRDKPGGELPPVG